MATFADIIREQLARVFAPPRVSQATAPATRRDAVDHADVVEPDTRTWIEWSPSMIVAAEIQCAGGSLRLAADLCHAMLGDDRIIATLGVRTRGLVGLPLTFEAGIGRRARRAQRAIEAGEDFWAMAPESTLAEVAMWAVFLGVGFGKLSAVDGASGRKLLRVEAWDPRHFRYDWTLRTWLVTTATGAELPINATDGRWLIFTPYGEHDPWRRGVWRALARWWLLKHYARSDWARHGEVKASGILVASREAVSGPGEKDLSGAQRRALAAQMRTLGRDAAVVLPAGFKADLVESAANNFQTFNEQINAANTGIAVAVLGQNLTTEVKGGSYAAAQVHQQVADFLRRADAECLSTTLHDQVLVWWAAYNFGDPSVAPWPTWRVDPDGDAAAIGTSFKALGEGLAALEGRTPEGFVVDREAVFARAGVPLVEAPTPPPAPIATLPPPAPGTPAAPAAPPSPEAPAP